MKYYLHLLRHMLPEWREAYINYKNLKNLLLPFKKHLSNQQTSKNETLFLEFIPSEKHYFLEINDIFIEALKAEILKFAKFAELQIFQSYHQWSNLLSNMETHEKMKKIHKNNEKQQIMMDVFHQFYSKLHYLKKFMDLNSQILGRILKKYHFNTSLFQDQINYRLLDKVKLLKSIKFIDLSMKLSKLIDEFIKIYMRSFYTKKNKKTANKVLQTITQEKQISHKEVYFFCFLAGFSFVLCMFILFLAIDGHFEEQTSFFNHVFPIYRGASFIVLYIFLLAWNVYGWNRFNINYRRIFKFNHHYSTLGQILKRGMFFWVVLLLTFIWYVLIESDLGSFSQYIDFLQKKYIALIIWFVLIGYMLFPSKKYCNGQGRLYVFRLLQRIVCLSFFHVDFIMNWATDQIVSFVTPLKDLEYTFCYFIEYSFSGKNSLVTADVCSEKTIYIGFVASSLPLFFRMVQCLRMTSQNWSQKEYYYDILNFFKYFSSLLVAIFSFMSGTTSQSTIFFQIWIFFAVISTLYSYSWDIKMDWGLLKTKNLLREKLLYDTKYYYFAIIINFIFRCSWVMTISNGVNPFGMQKEVFNFVFGFIEMFRRAIWNFMRVEKEYIFNTDLYKLYEDMRLPYPLEIDVKKQNRLSQLVENIKNEPDCSTFATKRKNEEESLKETIDETYYLSSNGVEEESLRIEFEVMQERTMDLSLRSSLLVRKHSSQMKESKKI